MQFPLPADERARDLAAQRANYHKEQRPYEITERNRRAQAEVEQREKWGELQAFIDKRRRELEEQRLTEQLLDTPQVRAPRDAYDFENVCAEWFQSQGIRAEVTVASGDRGADILGDTFVAQCKFHPSAKIGRPDIQRLKGSQLQIGRAHAFFFHYGPGYTLEALEAAETLEINCLELDADHMRFVWVSPTDS